VDSRGGLRGTVATTTKPSGSCSSAFPEISDDLKQSIDYRALYARAGPLSRTFRPFARFDASRCRRARRMISVTRALRSSSWSCDGGRCGLRRTMLVLLAHLPPANLRSVSSHASRCALPGSASRRASPSKALRNVGSIARHVAALMRRALSISSTSCRILRASVAVSSARSCRGYCKTNFYQRHVGRGADVLARPRRDRSKRRAQTGTAHLPTILSAPAFDRDGV